MSNTVHVYQAIREVAASTRATAGNVPCEVCGAQAASPYVFAHGRVVRRESTTSGNTTATTTYYDSVAARVVHLCDLCVDTHRQGMIRTARNRTIALAVVTVLLVIAAFLVPGNLDTAAAGLATACAIFTLLLYAEDCRGAG